MTMQITRRKLALAALGSAAAVRAVNAQTPPAQPQPESFNAGAREQVRSNSEKLAGVDLPMSTEPAFIFKA